MVKKTNRTESSEGLPSLTLSREDAENQLNNRIAAGEELLNLPIQTEEALEKAEQKYYNWDEYNGTLLQKMFSSKKIYDKYAFSGIRTLTYGFSEELKQYHNDLQTKLRRLNSVKEQLDLYEESHTAQTEKRLIGKLLPTTQDVFIVHGRDETTKQTVARFLQQLELKPIILHEQPSKGKTIIEKVEAYTDVPYAVVLLTPDDLGKLSSDEELTPRARQNVIFELGYLVGKLGRNRVSVLRRNKVEPPGDYTGVVYIPFDEGGGWKLTLASELKAAGLDVDLNKAI